LSRFTAWPPASVTRLLAIAVLSLAAVAAALYTQHQLDMQPCPWCILQRLIFLLMAALAGAGAAVRGISQRVSAGAVLLLALCGVAAALWQHFVAAASASCKLTLADQLISGSGLDAWWPEVFGVFASCADAKAHLAGVPYEFYSLTVFAMAAAGAWPVMRGRA
jgi:protein dithiol:quinone oxidoreductase